MKILFFHTNKLFCLAGTASCTRYFMEGFMQTSRDQVVSHVTLTDFSKARDRILNRATISARVS